MTRAKWTWCEETKQLVPYQTEDEKRQTSFVHVDDIPDGLESMVNGKIYTSKSRYRQHLKESGYIEKGNDKYNLDYTREVREAYDAQMEKDVERAYYEARDGMAPISEFTRERCKIIDTNREKYCYDRRD